MVSSVLKNSDIFGATSSSLCLAHCVLTPLLFLSPIWWWSSLNILFISVSFIAVYNSVKKTSRKSLCQIINLCNPPMNKMFNENPCAKRHGSGDHPGPLIE